MKHLEVTRANINYNDYKKRPAKESDYSTLITEDCAIFENGELKIIYQKLGFDSTELVKGLQKIEYSAGQRTHGLTTISKIFGYMPRQPIRGDYCKSARLSKENPKVHQIVCDYGKKVADLYKENDPDSYEVHLNTAKEKVLPEWIIPETPFTSGIINKNNPLNYHFDTGNFKDVRSCMLAYKHNIGGGLPSDTRIRHCFGNRRQHGNHFRWTEDFAWGNANQKTFTGRIPIHNRLLLSPTDVEMLRVGR